MDLWTNSSMLARRGALHELLPLAMHVGSSSHFTLRRSRGLL